MTYEDVYDGSYRPVEHLNDQRTFYTVPEAGPTLSPAFDRMYWIDFPLAEDDAAAMAAFGH